MSIATKPLGHICEHCGRSDLLMQIPEWSTKRPTDPGWYWVRGLMNRREQIVHIGADMCIYRNNNPNVYSLDLKAFDHCQWRPVL